MNLVCLDTQRKIKYLDILHVLGCRLVVHRTIPLKLWCAHVPEDGLRLNFWVVYDTLSTIPEDKHDRAGGRGGGREEIES